MLTIKDAEKCIEEIKAYDISKGRNPKTWFMFHNHIYGSAYMAKKLAERLNIIEPDRAFILGLLHDAGRLHEDYEKTFHGLIGYRRFLNIDEDVARISLTHMFPWNKVYDYECVKHFFFGKKDDYDFIKNYMDNTSLMEVDKLIQVSDSIANAFGFVTIEQRNEEYTKRHGHPIPINAYNDMLSLKKHFDEKLGVDIYTLFDEIPQDWKMKCA